MVNKKVPSVVTKPNEKTYQSDSFRITRRYELTMFSDKWTADRCHNERQVVLRIFSFITFCGYFYLRLLHFFYSLFLNCYLQLSSQLDWDENMNCYVVPSVVLFLNLLFKSKKKF